MHEHTHGHDCDCHEHSTAVQDSDFLVTDATNPILGMVGRPVTKENYIEASECLNKMKQVLSEKPCYGVAAQQVGHDLKLFVFRHGNEAIVCANPTIKKIKPTKYNVWSLEGCLSVPDKLYGVQRCSVVWLSYQDIYGKNEERRFKDLSAIVVQHELDHVNGKLICDTGYLYDKNRDMLVHPDSGRQVARGKDIHPVSDNI